LSLLIFPLWVKDKLVEETEKSGLSCPACGKDSVSLVRVVRKRVLYSFLPVSSRELGRVKVCKRCGARFPA
jgi:predicted RNA-binding Zn-ribbon protein involved in translation (DUF1610 family)